MIDESKENFLIIKNPRNKVDNFSKRENLKFFNYLFQKQFLSERISRIYNFSLTKCLTSVHFWHENSPLTVFWVVTGST